MFALTAGDAAITAGDGRFAISGTSDERHIRAGGYPEETDLTGLQTASCNLPFGPSVKTDVRFGILPAQFHFRGNDETEVNQTFPE
ncbi:MAG: hypothetical protein AB7T07_10200 [Steroidobacteraceae bacterium]